MIQQVRCRCPADLQQVERRAVEGLAEPPRGDERRAACARDKLGMARHRVRGEVGEAHLVADGPVADRQHLAVVLGRDAGPGLAILRGDGAVVPPAVRVGHAAGILDPEHAVLARGAAHAEVEPLEELAASVGHDLQPDPVGRPSREAADVAAVEIAVDGEAHGWLRRRARVRSHSWTRQAWPP